MALVSLNITYANNSSSGLIFSLWVATVELSYSCLLLICVKQVISEGMEPLLLPKRLV